MKLRNHIANAITSCRILCSILMLFFAVSSLQFFILYLFCGFSDMIDGTIARKTNCASEFGSRLDSIADFLFLAVSLRKFLPLIHIPKWLWVWIGAIAIIKLSPVAWGLIRKKMFISLHTVMNKITGALLFLLPLTLQFVELKYSSAVVCSMATISAIQEGFLLQREGKGN